MEEYRKLGVNTALAFVAGFVTSFGAFIAATPEDPGFAALASAGSAAVYAGGRAAVGFLKARFGTPVSVDV